MSLLFILKSTIRSSNFYYFPCFSSGFSLQWGQDDFTDFFRKRGFICPPVFFEDSAQLSLLRGVEELAGLLGPCYGPYGWQIVLCQRGAFCLVLSSGGGLLQELTPSDLGARLLQQALEKISERLGDGICLTALLSHSLVREGAQPLTAGIDPLRLRAELEDLSAQALAELRRSARPVPSLSEAIRLCCGAWEEEAGLLTEAF